MMSANNNPPPAKPAGKDETQSSTGRKTSSTARPQEPSLKCPRCDSPNTKFCYYNNYSLTQPRHFCKTCRRYWTKGGALRNVPIGGGCRKNKKMKSSQRVSGDSKDHSSGSSDIGGLKFFQGLSPAMDFQLGGININIPRIHQNTTSLFNPFGDASITSNPCFNTLDPSQTSSPLMGFSNFPLSPAFKQGENSNTTPACGFQEMGLHSSLASSIESLSSINQDLHWKLQQQRLSMLFVGDNNNNNNTVSAAGVSGVEAVVQKPQPILFQNLEISKAESCGKEGNLSTEWFFDNSSYANPTSSNNVNENASSWSGIQAWNDLTQYTALP